MEGMTLRSVRIVFAAALCAAACFSQTQTARLVGTVHDSTGAVLPNAKVSAVNVGTKVKTDTVSSSNGDYVLPALQPGTYELNVEATGFRKARVEGIELAAASDVSQAITLEVGQLTEVVEVTANTVNVQTSDAQVANSVSIKDIETLPQLARTPQAPKLSGSWWTDWEHWLAARSGALKPAPKMLGNRAHKAQAKAPGTYVLAH